VFENRGNPACVTTDHNGKAHKSRNDGQHGRKICFLADSTGNQHQLSRGQFAETFNRDNGRSHVGALGIIVIVHSGMHAHPLTAVWQPGELAKCFEHGCDRQTNCFSQSKGGERIGNIVLAGDLHLVCRQHYSIAARKKSSALLSQHAPHIACWRIKSETAHRAGVGS